MHKLHYVIMLVLVTLASGGLQAAKPGAGTPPPSGSACVGQGGRFPAMAYARAVAAPNGSYARTQIFVANSTGTCQVMVYDSGDYSFPLSSGLSLHYDAGSATGTLAWAQVRDNGETSRNGRGVIKVAQFHVDTGAVVGLPLTAATIYRASTTSVSISDVALSKDGLRVALSTEQPTTTSGVFLYQVLTCSTLTCSPVVDFASTTDKALDLALGRNPSNGAERIYLTYAHQSLAMMERFGPGWLSPTVLVSSADYPSEVNTQLYEPSVLSIGDQEDRVVLTSRQGTGAWRVDLYDVATHTLTPSIGFGYGPSWTLYPSIDLSAPNVLVNQNSGPSSASAFLEIDLDSRAEVSLPAVSGYGVDSAY